MSSDSSSESDGPTKTICPYCGVGCGIQIAQDDEGEVTFRPWPDAPVNEGSICIKGGAATQSVNHEDRLTDPLIRDDDGELHEATWEEAYDRIVDEMEGIRDEYSAQAMGFYGCSKAMNEENYLIQKLA
ncbi:MAG: molybdopterin oxidoreductase family protein, partial [Haloplanus sp.]